MRKNILVLAGILSVVLLLLGLWGFIDSQMKLTGSFPSNTRINGVDCSGLSVNDADTILTKEWNSKKYVINADGKYIGELSNINLNYDITGELQCVQVHSSISPLFTWLSKEQGSIFIPMSIDHINKLFLEQFNNLRLLKQPNYVETKNAYIDMSTPSLMIVKEVFGNEIDKEMLFSRIISDIEKGVFVLNAAEEEFYIKPTVFSDDPRLVANQVTYREYLGFEITYNFGDRHETLTPERLKPLLAYNGGKVTIIEDQVAKVIQDIAKKYDTVGSTRMFQTTNGGLVSVNGGSYGFRMDQDAEIQWLLDALAEGKTVFRTPEYLQEGRSRDQNDIGSSYVEIDISAQHLWIYQDGKLVLSTDVVTGNVSRGKNTPTGTYYIFSKQRDRILRGPDYDGTEYASLVAYWMPFNQGVGLHDAPWREAFGGGIYLKNGSHGCVNMPPAAARVAYYLVNIGFPVVVHH
jgi:lipoprotein-anchoring transpeptidase ErfK/SrfK/sporulation protein YlmC with PRC-barrel domain